METRNRSRPIKVGLMQINNSFSGKSYLPLSVGMIQAYCQKTLENVRDFEFLIPVFNRRPVSEIVEYLLDADIVLVSLYVWNKNISLLVCRELKRRKPNILIAVGGPQVPDRLGRRRQKAKISGTIQLVNNPYEEYEEWFDASRVETYLRDHSYIDIACHGEGEAIALALLKNFDGNWMNIPSISFIESHTGEFKQTNRLPRSANLDQFPSPYLEGTFDKLMADYPEQDWIVSWETNRGCPFSCTFCDWGGAVLAKVNKFGMDRIQEEVRWFSDHKITFILCCDANFGIFTRDLDIAHYLAKIRIETGFPSYISIQSTKNASERSYLVQKAFANAGMSTTIVLSRQSLDPTTLADIKRSNISNDVYSYLQRKFNADRIETLTDLILPLPGETYNSFVNGVCELMNLGQHNRINFNNLSSLPNAEVGDPDYQKKYGLKIVVTKVVNTHGFLPDNDEIMEEQELVVATNTANLEDWRRMRAFGWMVSFLHFDKLLQIPIINLHHLANISYRKILELFSEINASPLAAPGTFPTLEEIRQFFLDRAMAMQNGDYEFPHSKEWLNIFWHPDEYMLIKLVTENKLHVFYNEALEAMSLLVKSKSQNFDLSILSDAIKLNEAMMKLPLQTTDLEVTTSYNTHEIYRSIVEDNPIPIDHKVNKYKVDRTTEVWNSLDDWLEKVPWYGYRRGAYWYGTVNTEISLAGHY